MGDGGFVWGVVVWVVGLEGVMKMKGGGGGLCVVEERFSLVF